MVKKVLIIEDDSLMVKIYQARLSKDNIKVYAAANGKEGLQLYQEKQPDLIVLDLPEPWKVIDHAKKSFGLTPTVTAKCGKTEVTMTGIT